MKKVIYSGTGRGQGHRITVAGYKFERNGEPVDVPDDLAETLNDREGFEILKPSKKGKGVKRD